MVSNAAASQCWQVSGPGGIAGVIHELPTDAGESLIELSDGRKLRLPGKLLRRDEDGFALELTAAQTEELQKKIGLMTVPVVREQIHVEKERKEGQSTVIHVVPTVLTEAVDVPVTLEQVEIERVPLNRIVAQAEAPRTEGDVTVIPVYEEVLVVEKRLMLKEEVRITRRRSTVNEHRDIQVRREEVHVLRSNPQES